MPEDFRALITRADIQNAIAALDRGEVHAFGPSTTYDVLEGDRRYPPKAVVGLAARRVLGRASAMTSFPEVRIPGRSNYSATRASVS